MRKPIIQIIPVLLGLAWAASCQRALAQGTAFTYQGHLTDGGNSAHGLYNLEFLLYNVSSGGSAVAGPITSSGIVVSNGLFTVVLDFGTGVFNGTTYWLQIGVETNGGGSFTLLSPRQELTPAPYSIYSENAGVATAANSVANGIVSAQQLNTLGAPGTGQVLGYNGSGLVWTNPASASFAWNLSGNAGTTPAANFLGTTDNEPLDLDSSGERGLQLQYVSRSAPPPIIAFTSGMNVLGGFWGNTISNNVIGATIAGGGYSFYNILTSASYPNVVSGDFGSIGGGYGNTAGTYATIPGGYNNVATGAGSFAAGRNAQTANAGNFVWSDGSETPFAGTGANAFDVLASGGVNFFNGSAGVNVDELNGNNGSINYGLRFGVGSGEGIGSKRSSGGNQYGLDFYTSFNNRMSILNNGFVGINTTAASQQLEVNGEFIMVDGLGGVRCYLGDDGFGNDVQIGSLTPGVTAVACYNATDNAYMHLYCSSITIEGGADLAEPFEMTGPAEEIPQGAVVVIDGENPGRLKLSDRPYDARVAGVVSGANGINPGIQMQQQGLLEGGKNVALSGRVYVLADASGGAIHPGDMLTTSSTPGHAMKVSDHARASGAILGKAMTELSEGKGMVLVLVTLQ